MIKLDKNSTKDELMYRLWIQKIRVLGFWFDIKRSYRYNKYCKKDYHKLENGFISTTNHKEETLEVEYLECKICRCCWFVNKEDKEKYLRIKESYSDIIAFALTKDGKENK